MRDYLQELAPERLYASEMEDLPLNEEMGR